MFPGVRKSLLLGLLLLPLVGCVSTGSSKQPAKAEQAPTAPVHQVHCTWANQIIVTPDVVNGGAALPGLAGRLYLFGPDLGVPVKGNGKVIVDLFDPTQKTPEGGTKMLARWEYDNKTLERLLRKDMIGWGYTLFLPWQEYRPDMKRVQLKVCYVTEGGGTMFAPQSVVSIRGMDSGIVTEERTIMAEDLPPQGPNIQSARQSSTVVKTGVVR